MSRKSILTITLLLSLKRISSQELDKMVIQEKIQKIVYYFQSNDLDAYIKLFPTFEETINQIKTGNVNDPKIIDAISKANGLKQLTCEQIITNFLFNRGCVYQFELDWKFLICKKINVLSLGKSKIDNLIEVNSFKVNTMLLDTIKNIVYEFYISIDVLENNKVASFSVDEIERVNPALKKTEAISSIKEDDIEIVIIDFEKHLKQKAIYKDEFYYGKIGKDSAKFTMQYFLQK
jgi:hypothetical protein